jgi:ribosomal protein S18 acetylase RimI-like enzyme
VAPDSVVIRSLTSRDRAAVIRIDAGLTGATQRAYWSRVFKELLARGRKNMPVGLAAEVQGSVAGFLVGDVRAFEFGSEPCGWILEVGVQPRHARAGVGSALLMEACRRFRAAGVPTIRTMVRRNDVPVLTFFRSNGFVGGPYVQLEWRWPESGRPELGGGNQAGLKASATGTNRAGLKASATDKGISDGSRPR